jgi:hypothetical protein
MSDLCDHVAAVLHPLPEPGEVSPPEAFDDVVDLVQTEREQAAEALRTAWDNSDEEVDEDGDPIPWSSNDPLLSAIADLRREKERADAAIRRLLAFAREYNRPTPYQLSDLALAAGMSISGIRTAYTDKDITLVGKQVKMSRRTS